MGPLCKRLVTWTAATLTVAFLSPGTARPAAKTVSADYVQALGAADSFLSAWQSRDTAKGASMLSDRLRKRTSKENLDAYFCSVSNPHHESFVIVPGRRNRDGSFGFPAKMYLYYTGDRRALTPSPTVYIRVIHVARDTWKVDNLP